MERISAIEALQPLKAGVAVVNAEVLELINLLALCLPHPPEVQEGNAGRMDIDGYGPGLEGSSEP